MDTHTHTHIHIHNAEEVTKLPLRGTIAGGSWEGKRARVYSHCAILGGKALPQEPASASPMPTP